MPLFAEAVRPSARSMHETSEAGVAVTLRSVKNRRKIDRIVNISIKENLEFFESRQTLTRVSGYVRKRQAVYSNPNENTRIVIVNPSCSLRTRWNVIIKLFH